LAFARHQLLSGLTRFPLMWPYLSQTLLISPHTRFFSPALLGIHVVVVQNTGTTEVDLLVECQTTAGPPIRTAVHLAAEAAEIEKAAGEERAATNYVEPEKTTRATTRSPDHHHIDTATQNAAHGWFEGKYGRLARV
jgi:hypothetical protein